MQRALYCLVHNIEKLGHHDTADRKAAATMTLPDAGENHEHDVFGSAYAIT